MSLAESRRRRAHARRQRQLTRRRRLTGFCGLAMIGLVILAAPGSAHRSIPKPRPRPHHTITSPRTGPGETYRGLGFDPDPCQAPTLAAMTVWRKASPYRAAGVYIGGLNASCQQTHLDRTWIQGTSRQGWHLLPLYVGLQAPENMCGCAGIDPAHAYTQGAAQAADAERSAQALGLGPGNPVYFDMEAYDQTPSNSNAVMVFLAGWTRELHAGGYLSGVYSSASSGISDLETLHGSRYPEPDDVWAADYNARADTSEPQLPAGSWTHRRAHQYSDSHDERYGGVTINIDDDYVDGATATSSS